MLFKYEITAEGTALGAVAVVLANSWEEAKKLATSKGMKECEIGHPKYTGLTGPAQVVYYWDGDY